MSNEVALEQQNLTGHPQGDAPTGTQWEPGHPQGDAPTGSHGGIPLRVPLLFQHETIDAIHPIPRVLFFGMQGNFSLPSLQALLENNIEVCAVVLPAASVPGIEPVAIQRSEPPRGRRAALPMLSASRHPSILHIAWECQIPVWDVYRLSDQATVSILAAYRPDVICVACFSQRIPHVIRDMPRLGCLNVHPGLLPANRGPVPLFWTFRNGDEVTGVSIHMLEEKMDAGDMLAQERIRVPDGITYAQLEMQCASLGGKLLARSVWDLYEGRAAPVPQDETQSSYHSFPTDADFVVQVEQWDARHIYNFVRGAGQWDMPIELHANGLSFPVREGISYSHKNTNNDSVKVEHLVSGEMKVYCKEGWVIVR